MAEPLKTVYNYLFFVVTTDGSWVCYNRKSKANLGEVVWYPEWRRWCYAPATNTIYSPDCLADIRHFIVQLPPKSK